MKMLRWMCEVTREDRIRNEYITTYIMRQKETKAVKVVMKINVDRIRGKTKKVMVGYD
jgi:hypothetical protein